MMNNFKKKRLENLRQETVRQKKTNQSILNSTRKKNLPQISQFINMNSINDSMHEKNQVIQKETLVLMMKKDAEDRLTISKLKKNLQQLCLVNDSYQKKIEESQQTQLKNKQYINKLEKAISSQKKRTQKKKLLKSQEKILTQILQLQQTNTLLIKIIEEFQNKAYTNSIKSQPIQININLKEQMNSQINKNKQLQLTVNPQKNFYFQGFHSQQNIAHLYDTQQNKQVDQQDQQQSVEEVTQQQILQIANSEHLEQILLNKQYGKIVFQKMQEYNSKNHNLPQIALKLLEQYSFLNKSQIKDQLQNISNDLSYLQQKKQ